MTTLAVSPAKKIGRDWFVEAKWVADKLEGKQA